MDKIIKLLESILGGVTNPQPAELLSQSNSQRRPVIQDNKVIDRQTGGWRWLNQPTPTPTPAPAQASAPMMNPEVMGISTESPYIGVPGANGSTQQIPSWLAQILLNSFNDIGEATNSARVLTHPMQTTLNDAELMRIYGRIPDPRPQNLGENPGFDLRARYLQGNGTEDYGLMRNNSGSLAGLLNNPFWANRLAQRGVTSFEQMNNPQASADAARVLLERGNWDNQNKTIRSNPSWREWYAAPMDLRAR